MALHLVKIKRMNSIVRVKKAAFENAASKLSELRQQRYQLVQSMRSTQRNYMEGIDRLNNERSSPSREKLVPLEKGLDKVKGDWMSLYQKVLDAEKVEKAQERVVNELRIDLEAIEKLGDKYHLDFKKSLDKQDQKTLDEAAIRRFVQGAK